jgi:NAD+ synthase (glutamine-hydrolysing)
MQDNEQRPALRVGLVQFKPIKPRVAENLARVQTQVASAAGTHDLLVFPEAALSGYFIEGGVVEAALSTEAVASGLGEASPNHPDVVLGFYERWRDRLYNSIAHFTPQDQRYVPLHVHRKMFLPTYGVFDEARFVESGREISSYDSRFGRLGLLICEEMWHSLPATILALGGAQLLVVSSASPARDFRDGSDGRPGNLGRWDSLVVSAAVEHGVFVVVSQLVGSEGGKVFPGGSLAVAPDGRVLARGPLLEECTVAAVLDPGEVARARYGSPLLADLEQKLPDLRRSLDQATDRHYGSARGRRSEAPGTPTDPGGLRGALAGTPEHPSPDDPGTLALDVELVERVLVRFIREELERRGFQKVVLGASGGVDSSVVLYLAARALGPENVHAFRLPYRTSSEESLAHAHRVIEETGAHGHTIEISDPVDAYVQRYEPEITPLRRGNLMARLRGVVLFDQSAKLQALPLGTGNKSERLLGYFTWHADDSPPINPLGDLFKTQVWALATHLGVPEEIVKKPATADLVKGVNDEDELGISYQRADPILHWLLEGYAPETLVRRGFDAKEVSLVWRRLNSTHWKRELPSVAVLSSSAIGEFYLRPVDY